MSYFSKNKDKILIFQDKTGHEFFNELQLSNALRLFLSITGGGMTRSLKQGLAHMITFRQLPGVLHPFVGEWKQKSFLPPIRAGVLRPGPVSYLSLLAGLYSKDGHGTMIEPAG